MNDIKKWLDRLQDITPFEGYVPKGFIVDFLGCLTDANFRVMWGVNPAETGGAYIVAARPDLGEGFAEAVSWLEAAREARDAFVMITLGACYGGQAVGAYRALQQVNPMPAKLVAVEPDPENFVWLRKNFRDNGIDPKDHWLLNCALSDSNKPVLFPTGSPGSGANNCYYTNNPGTRREFAQAFTEMPRLAERVADLVIEGDTGIDINLAPGWDFPARIKFVSAVTLADVLAPFDRVDLLEADIQQSEKIVFPPAMDLIKAKVRRVQIGTHGEDAHYDLLQAFATRRFEIIFNFEPTRDYETPYGSFKTQDGIITARNLDL